MRRMAANDTLSQAQAARDTDVFPVRLHRHIKEPKKSCAFDMFMELARAERGEPELAPAPVASDAATPPAPPSPTALKSTLEGRVHRLGDGRPYGTHGSVGMYREGVKEVTLLMKAEVLTPSGKAASMLLKEVGVTVGVRTLHDLAKEQPGKSPQRTGDPTRLAPETEASLREYVLTLREARMCACKIRMQGPMRGASYLSCA